MTALEQSAASIRAWRVLAAEADGNAHPIYTGLSAISAMLLLAASLTYLHARRAKYLLWHSREEIYYG